MLEFKQLKAVMKNENKTKTIPYAIIKRVEIIQYILPITDFNVSSEICKKAKLKINENKLRLIPSSKFRAFVCFRDNIHRQKVHNILWKKNIKKFTAKVLSLRFSKKKHTNTSFKYCFVP